MKMAVCVTAGAWMILCVIVNILIYRHTRSWYVRWAPAFVKLTAIALCGLLHFLLPDPPMADDETPLFFVIGLIFLMGIVVDIWAWFFSEGFPSKRKRLIYACGCGIAILIAVVYLMFTESNSYRVSHSASFRHYTFDAYTGEISKTLQHSDNKPQWCFTYDAKQGTLELLVTDEAGQILYSGTPEDPSEFAFNTTGPIHITITTEAFTGTLNADRINPDDPNGR